jgi:ABC-2 type transport system permease protein
VSTETHGTVDRRERDTGTLQDVLRFEAERRVRVTGVIVVLLSVLGAFYIWLGPQIVTGTGMEEILDSLPPAMNVLFGFESLTSLEGLLASEYYTFGYIVGLGAYVAYSAAGSVAGDVQHDRMDTVLSAPISRTSVLLGKYLALLVPILAANVVVPIALSVASVLVGDPIAAEPLVVVHVLAVPYLLCWSAVGLLIGAVVHRGRTAGRIAMALVFAAWILESFLTTTDYSWLGGVSPTRYFDPPDVFVNGIYDLVGAVILLAAAVVLLGIARAWFQRHDV